MRSALLGCDGCVLGMASMYPKVFVEAYNASLTGDVELMRKFNKLICLAFLVETLTTVLSGGSFDIKSWLFAPPESRSNLGHTMLVINVGKMMDPMQFASRLSASRPWVRLSKSPTAPATVFPPVSCPDTCIGCTKDLQKPSAERRVFAYKCG